MSAKVQFINWLKVKDPFLYKVAETRYLAKNPGAQLNGLGGFADFFTSVVDTVKNVAPQVMQYAAQKKIINAQIKRAEQGLPPMEVSQYAPTVRVEPVMNPETEAAARRVGMELVRQGIGDLKPVFLVGAVGLVAFFMFKRRK